MSQAVPSSSSPRSGSVVWALILISAGVIWLLREANILTGQNLAVLFRLWPLILIAIGVELLIGRGSRTMSVLIVGVTIVVLIALMFVGPSIGLGVDVEIKTMTFEEPLADTQSARVSIGMAVGPGTVYALEDSNDLIAADLRYVGEVKYEVEPGTQTVVNLTHSGSVSTGFDFLGWTVGLDEKELHWNVGLSPQLPLDLTISSGVGDNGFDLTGLQLTSLNFNSGVGDANITLPTTDGVLPVDVNSGVGSTTLNIPEGAFVNASISGGVGDTFVDVMDDAPIRLESSGGLGNVNVPSSWTRVSGENDNGVWESPSYSEAPANARIDLDYNGGVGSLHIS